MITLGVLFLFVMFRGLRFPLFLTFYYFWPVFLIGGGIALIFRKYPFVQTLIFLVEVLLFISLGSYIGGGGDVDFSSAPERRLDSSQDVILVEDTEVALEYDVLFANGDVNVGEVDFYRVETEDRRLSADYDEKDRIVHIGSEESGVVIWPGNRSSDVTLSADYAWDVHIDGVFSSMRADLDELNLISLYSEAAFCSNVIRLPEPRGTVPVVLDSAFSSTVIYLPAGTPVSIAVDKGLSRATYGPTVLKDATHHFGGYNQAEDRYEITVDLGLGSLDFKEY